MKPERARLFREGFVAGLIGYAAVAVFYAAVNVLSGKSLFHTAAALGARMAGIEAAPGQVVIAPAPIFAYNGVHLLAFLVIGLAAAWLVYETELHPEFVYVMFFAGLAGAGFALLFFLLLAMPTAAVLPWWSVLGANVAAGGAIGAYLLRAHPGLMRKVEAGENATG